MLRTRRARRLVRPFIRQRPSSAAAAAAREVATLTAVLGQSKFSRGPAALARSPDPSATTDLRNSLGD